MPHSYASINGISKSTYRRFKQELAKDLMDGRLTARCLESLSHMWSGVQLNI